MFSRMKVQTNALKDPVDLVCLCSLNETQTLHDKIISLEFYSNTSKLDSWEHALSPIVSHCYRCSSHSNTFYWSRHSYCKSLQQIWLFSPIKLVSNVFVAATQLILLWTIFPTTHANYFILIHVFILLVDYRMLAFAFCKTLFQTQVNAVCQTVMCSNNSTRLQ